MPEITECTGYKKLLAATEADLQKAKTQQFRVMYGKEYSEKLEWVIARAQHYATATGLDAAAILDVWEQRRSYWYMNYYQDCNFPMIGPGVRIFETSNALEDSIGVAGFRCPACGGISKNAYECNAGGYLGPGKVCDWKVYGLFKDLGKGVFIFVKEKMYGQKIFMPVAWETKENN